MEAQEICLKNLSKGIETQNFTLTLKQMKQLQKRLPYQKNLNNKSEKKLQFLHFFFKLQFLHFYSWS